MFRFWTHELNLKASEAVMDPTMVSPKVLEEVVPLLCPQLSVNVLINK